MWYSLLVLGDRQHKNKTEQVIAETLESVTSWQTKIKLVRKAGEAWLNAEDADKLVKILTRSEGVQKRRNQVVHGLWYTNPKDPETWIRQRSFTQDEPAHVYDEHCLKELIRDIGRLSNDLRSFMHDMRAYLFMRDFFERMKIIMEAEDTEDAGDS